MTKKTPDQIAADVAYKFHLDYDRAVEKAEISGDEELAEAGRQASGAYDLVSMFATAAGCDSQEYKDAQEKAKRLANAYAAIVRDRENAQ